MQASEEHGSTPLREEVLCRDHAVEACAGIRERARVPTEIVLDPQVSICLYIKAIRIRM